MSDGCVFVCLTAVSLCVRHGRGERVGGLDVLPRAGGEVDLCARGHRPLHHHHHRARGQSLARSWDSRPDMTYVVDRALKANDLSICSLDSLEKTRLRPLL